MQFTTNQTVSDALEGLKHQPEQGPLQQDTIWLASPANLYIENQQAEAYLDLMRDNVYGGGFHAKVKRLISNNRGTILANLTSTLDFVDLGPGFPDKSFPLLASMSTLQMKGRYIPVDVNHKFLQIAENACKAYGFPIRAVHGLFEEIPSKLPAACHPRLFMLGVTFMNYTPDAGISLLKRMLRPGDAAVIAGELKGDDDAALLAPYQSEKARRFNYLSVQSSGAPEEKLQYFVRLVNDRIEMGFRAKGPFFRETRNTCRSGICHVLFVPLWPKGARCAVKEAFQHQLFCDPRRSCIVARVSSPLN